jgi:hypothetical protein
MQQAVDGGVPIDPVFLNAANYYSDNGTRIAHPYHGCTHEIDLSDESVARNVFASLCRMRFPFRALKFPVSLKLAREAVHEYEMQKVADAVRDTSVSVRNVVAANSSFSKFSADMYALVSKGIDGKAPVPKGAVVDKFDRAKQDISSTFADRFVTGMGSSLQRRIDAEDNGMICSNFGYLHQQMTKQLNDAVKIREFSLEHYMNLQGPLRDDGMQEFFYVFNSGHHNNGSVMNAFARYAQHLSKRSSAYTYIPLLDTSLTAAGNRIASDMLMFKESLGLVTGHHYFHFTANGARYVAVHNDYSKMHMVIIGPPAAGKSHIMYLMIACSVDGTLITMQGKSDHAMNDETAEDDLFILSDEASPLVSCDPATLDPRKQDAYNRERVIRSEGIQSGVRSVQGVYSRRYVVSHKITCAANANRMKAAEENSMQTRHRIISLEIERSNPDAVLSQRVFAPRTLDKHAARTAAVDIMRTDQTLGAIVVKMQYCRALPPTCTLIGSLLGPEVMTCIGPYLPSPTENVRPNDRMMIHLAVHPVYRAINALYHTQASPFQNEPFDLSHLRSVEPHLCATMEDFHWVLGYTLNEYLNWSFFMAMAALAITKAKFKPSSLYPLFRARPRNSKRNPTADCRAASKETVTWPVLGWTHDHYGRSTVGEMPAFWRHELHVIHALVSKSHSATSVPCFRKRQVSADSPAPVASAATAAAAATRSVLLTPAEVAAAAAALTGGGGADAAATSSATGAFMYDPNYVEIRGKSNELVAIACALLEPYAGASANSVQYYYDKLLQTAHNTMVVPQLAPLNSASDPLCWLTTETGMAGVNKHAIVHRSQSIMEYSAEAGVLYISTYWLAACTPRAIWATAYTCTEDKYIDTEVTHVIPYPLPGAPHLTDTIRRKPNVAHVIRVENPLYSGGDQSRIGRDQALAGVSTTVSISDIVTVLRRCDPTLPESQAVAMAQIMRDRCVTEHAKNRLSVKPPKEFGSVCELDQWRNCMSISLTSSVEKLCYQFFVSQEALYPRVRATSVEDWPEYPGNLDADLRRRHDIALNNEHDANKLLPTSAYPSALFPGATERLLRVYDSSMSATSMATIGTTGLTVDDYNEDDPAANAALYNNSADAGSEAAHVSLDEMLDTRNAAISRQTAAHEVRQQQPGATRAVLDPLSLEVLAMTSVDDMVAARQSMMPPVTRRRPNAAATTTARPQSTSAQQKKQTPSPLTTTAVPMDITTTTTTATAVPATRNGADGGGDDEGSSSSTGETHQSLRKRALAASVDDTSSSTTATASRKRVTTSRGVPLVDDHADELAAVVYPPKQKSRTRKTPTTAATARLSATAAAPPAKAPTPPSSQSFAPPADVHMAELI